MNRKIYALILSVCLLNPPLLADTQKLPPLPKGPLLLTSVRPEQLSAEYWIKRLPNPNRLIKNAEQMKAFNADIRAMIPERKDIFAIGNTFHGKSIKDQIELEYKTLRGRKLFYGDNTVVQKTFFDEKVGPILGLEQIPSNIKLKWGAAVNAASVRALPTDVLMIEEKDDVEFDQLQFTLIKLWTPVAIYHESKDKQWYYIQAPYVRGWVKAKSIAIFPERAKLDQLLNKDKFLVVTGESATIFGDAAKQSTYQRVSMGTVLPLKERNTEAGINTVWVPKRGEGGHVALHRGYVSFKSDVSVGFLPYTQANVIRQAFKLLSARYGWGGMYNGRDCSGFTHDVFLTFGIEMPRDSKQQGYTGTQLGHYKPYEDNEARAAALRAATPGITLIRMPKHIMLYLGEENGQFYVIHSTWAERISRDDDTKNRINQVVVSDLELNGKSYLGSLFLRTISINEVN